MSLQNGQTHRIEGGALRRPVRRALVIRCCRGQRFAEAVADSRRRFPSARITALCGTSASAEVEPLGVDEIQTYGTRHLGLAHLARTALRGLRPHRFDAVVIPYMPDGDDVGHANVHRLALALLARQTWVLRGEVATPYSRLGLARLAARTTSLALLRSLDFPLMLAWLALCRLVPRRRLRQDGRRRVLHVITSLGCGGAQRQLVELLDRTPADRFDVDVLVLNRDDGDFWQASVPRHVTVRYHEGWKAHAFLASARVVWRACTTGQYDIVHAWLFHANVAAAAGARLAGVPRVIISIRSHALWRWPWYRRRRYQAADALAARAADLVTVNASPLVADYAGWALIPASRIEVVENGLDPRALATAAAGDREEIRRELGVESGDLVMGIVGRLAPEKDIALYLRLVDRLRSAFPMLRALVVGDGSLRRELERMAADLGISDRALFLGERADAVRIVGTLDLFVMTSFSEGFPNALLEATLLGIPSLATEVGAARDMVGDEGALFPVGDLDAAHACAAGLLADREASLARAQRIQARAAGRFTSDRAAAKWLSLYEPRGYRHEAKVAGPALLPVVPAGADPGGARP